MLPNWTNHLKTEDEKKRFRAYLHNNRGVLDRLLEICQDMERDLEVRELDADYYDSPSWAARQADNNGYRRCLRIMKNLLTLDQGKVNG